MVQVTVSDPWRGFCKVGNVENVEIRYFGMLGIRAPGLLIPKRLFSAVLAQHMISFFWKFGTEI
jgi:hypothetical protein